MGDHLVKLGNSLTNAVDSYNKTVGSIESRVLVSARKFKELSVTGAKGAQLEEILSVEQTPRLLSAPELTLITTSQYAEESSPLDVSS